MLTGQTNLSIDGVTPGETTSPVDAAGIARLLHEFSEKKYSVAPLGGGTMLDLGRPLDRVDLAISTSKLTAVLDHQPANLTVKTEAGITLDSLNAALAREGQTLPLDPPRGERATIGGILAANASGPKRVRFGAARDLLIGLRVALPDGQIVHGGGDVVKNVAGYDLPKLFIGSLGTLGIIVEASFKIVPLPPASATLVAGFDRLEEAFDLGLRVLRSPLLPYGVEVVNFSAAAALGLERRCAAIIRFAGLASAVGRQLSDTDKWAREGKASRVESLDEDAALWARLCDLVYDRPVVLKLSALPADLAGLANSAEQVAAAHGLTACLLAHSVGILLVGLSGPGDAIAAVAEMRAAAEARQARLVVQRASREVRAQVDVWGPVGSDLAIMQRLKKAFDPNRILNPGRFVGGI